jgi:predicted DNA-binding transcriptional regulator YafY
MERTERFYRMEQLLRERRSVPRKVFLEDLEVSPATFKRDLDYLRDRFKAPIEWDAESHGYRLDPTAPRFELPGLWFSPAETYALLTMQHLLETLQPGLLTPHVKPLLERLRAVLDKGDHSAAEVERRIHVLQQAARKSKLEHFEVVASAVLKRKRLSIRHYNRQRNEETERTISPQHLVHYRGNWYVDAWCHKAEDVRSFALDAIRSALLLDQKAKEVPKMDLDEHFQSGYGIFAGKNVLWAKLRFTPERARWVSSEDWHPKQKSFFEADGSYVLEVPYSDDRELLMDILKFGADVEVLAPAELRRKARETLKAAVARYAK